MSSRRHFLEDEGVGRREHDGGVHGHHDQVVLPVPFVLVLVAVGVLEREGQVGRLLVSFCEMTTSKLAPASFG